MVQNWDIGNFQQHVFSYYSAIAIHLTWRIIVEVILLEK